MENTSIAALFEGVVDFRREHLRRYHLTDILFLCICASLCGADAYTQIAVFGEERQEWLQKFGAFPNGVPSHDTIQRTLELLPTQELGALLRNWSQSLCDLRAKEGVAIDGKALRGTWKKTGKPGLTLVSVWASNQRLCLGVEAVAATDGERAAAEILLDLIDLRGKVITADAGFAETCFCTKILNKKADYIIGLKANQPTLMAKAIACFADCEGAKNP
jgi:DDE_Tnp_1-associated/Transposase DDE domain